MWHSIALTDPVVVSRHLTVVCYVNMTTIALTPVSSLCGYNIIIIVTITLCVSHHVSGQHADGRGSSVTLRRLHVSSARGCVGAAGGLATRTRGRARACTRGSALRSPLLFGRDAALRSEESRVGARAEGSGGFRPSRTTPGRPPARAPAKVWRLLRPRLPWRLPRPQLPRWPRRPRKAHGRLRRSGESGAVGSAKPRSRIRPNEAEKPSERNQAVQRH